MTLGKFMLFLLYAVVTAGGIALMLHVVQGFPLWIALTASGIVGGGFFVWLLFGSHRWMIGDG